jgi:hypothetical protein
VDRSDRLILLLLVVAVIAWRLYRLLRLGLSRRSSALGIAGGWFPADTAGAASPPSASIPGSGKSLPGRIVGGVAAALIWISANLLIWAALFELPLMRNAPPIPLGVVWIVANFYLIPLARRIGAYCVRRWAS